MYEKLVVQVLGLAKDWYFMKRNLNYKGKVYESLKKLCDENGISYSGLAMYIARDKERHLSDIQSDEEVIEYLLEYIKLKEEGRRKGNYRVKGNIFLGGKLYSNLTDVYKNTKINAPGFSRYCIRNLGIAPADLDESTLIQTLNKYYDKVKSGKTFKSMVRIEYDGKVYSRVKEACLGARVNNKKFENYCMEMFGVMPRYLGDVLSDVFMDFVNSEKVKRYVRLQSLYGDKAEEVMKRISINNMDICMEAVKEDGHALKYVEEQTEEICLEAIKNDISSLQYVRKQTRELCREAIRMNPRALLYADSNLVDPIYYEMAIANNTFGKNPKGSRSQGVCQG